MLSLVGLLGALALLIALTVRGMNLFIATPLCALLLALTSGIPLLAPLAAGSQPDLVSAYMTGFTGFIASWFFMFLLGSIFGKLMEDSGAASSVSRWITGKLGIKRAALAVVAACAILTYGGVSLFVVAFSVYPMALALFRQADQTHLRHEVQKSQKHGRYECRRLSRFPRRHPQRQPHQRQ